MPTSKGIYITQTKGEKWNGQKIHQGLANEIQKENTKRK